MKANSEGQPGPQDYKRTHADGANMLADAVAPHGGIVMWRAFVYSPDNVADRVTQAQAEFQPLDGQFRDNVILQIKNGPLDFMPREPFSPLFGAHAEDPARARTAGHAGIPRAVDPARLPRRRCGRRCSTPTPTPAARARRSAKVVDGSLRRQRPSLIAGVANIGSDRNWTGHLLAQANWYAFGRLAWDHTLGADAIADEWTRMTFGSDAATVDDDRDACCWGRARRW